MSESFKGVDPGMNGMANAKFPIGTMTVDAMNKTFAEPNLQNKKENNISAKFWKARTVDTHVAILTSVCIR